MQTFQLTPSRRATLRDVDKLEVQEFQLTPSRRATHSDLHSLDFLIYFNSRPHGGRLQPVADQIHLKNFNSRPHGGRREKSVNFPVWLISTHALTEGDEHGYQIADSNSIFQLTPSRRATSSSLSSGNSGIYFNSRPHGGRRSCAVASRSWIYFNSRPHGGRRILPEGGVT